MSRVSMNESSRSLSNNGRSAPLLLLRWLLSFAREEEEEGVCDVVDLEMARSRRSIVDASARYAGSR